MENKSTKKSLIWLIIVVAVVAVAAVVVGILYFAPQEKPDPTARDKAAAQFIEAYITRDRLTQFDLLIYDARSYWEDNRIKEHGSEEKFCEIVQKQAVEQGIDVTIHCFEDYLRGYHQQDLVYKKEAYGDYTLTATAVSSEKMDANQAADQITATAGTIGTPYFADDLADTIDEVYVVTVNLAIDGTIKDLNEQYMVYMANCGGQWRVLSHTT